MKKLVALIFLFTFSGSLADVMLRLVQGEAAAEGEFPHHVMIQLRGSLKCGGTILDAWHIITAAHCTLENGQPVSPGDLSILAGTINTSPWFSSTYDVKAIHRHKDYAHADSYINDIAILKLDEEISFNSEKQPIKLPKEETPEGSSVVLTGWGKLKDSPGLADLPQYLRKLTTKVISNDACEKHYRRKIIDQQLCTYKAAGHGACTGDSGGGLVENGVLVGIASWVSNPCAKGHPDVFTRVYQYLPWIEETLKA